MNRSIQELEKIHLNRPTVAKPPMTRIKIQKKFASKGHFKVIKVMQKCRLSKKARL